MSEALIFLIAAICGLFIAGFSVHMFIGGLVGANTENQIIGGVCLIVAVGIGYMAWDVIKKRAGR
jgi:hypothetical protein